jgi:hypothetical protein
MLLVQWVHDAGRYDREVSALLTGPLYGVDHSRETFNGVPQLFAVLDEPDPAVLAEVRDVAVGAHVGYCMTRRLLSRPLGSSRPLGPYLHDRHGGGFGAEIASGMPRAA